MSPTVQPASNWYVVADRATLAARRWIEAAAGSAAVLVYDIDGAVFATSAICPHHAAWLSQGAFEGGFVDCPRHQGRFAVATGEQVRGPACGPLRVFPVRVDGTRVLVAA